MALCLSSVPQDLTCQFLPRLPQHRGTRQLATGLQEPLLGIDSAAQCLVWARDRPWSAWATEQPHSPCSSVDQHCLPPTKGGQAVKTGDCQ